MFIHYGRKNDKARIELLRPQFHMLLAKVRRKVRSRFVTNYFSRAKKKWVWVCEHVKHPIARKICTRKYRNLVIL